MKAVVTMRRAAIAARPGAYAIRAAAVALVAPAVKAPLSKRSLTKGLANAIIPAATGIQINEMLLRFASSVRAKPGHRPFPIPEREGAITVVTATNTPREATDPLSVFEHSHGTLGQPGRQHFVDKPVTAKPNHP